MGIHRLAYSIQVLLDQACTDKIGTPQFREDVQFLLWFHVSDKDTDATLRSAARIANYDQAEVDLIRQIQDKVAQLIEVRFHPQSKEEEKEEILALIAESNQRVLHSSSRE